MNNFGVRIKEARLEKGLTRKQLAKLTDTAEKTIYNYETNKAPITIDFLIVAAEQLGVSYDYLARLDDLSISRVHKSNNLPITLPNQLQTLNNDIVSIPFYEDISASAGSGAYNETETSHVMTFGKGFLREYFGLISFKDLSIIRSVGDSMYPTLPQNCYVLMQKKAVKESEICVTRIDDELYIKRLQKQPTIRLLSDNTAYQPIDLESKNFEIIGSVVGFFKKTAP